MMEVDQKRKGNATSRHRKGFPSWAPLWETKVLARGDCRVATSRNVIDRPLYGPARRKGRKISVPPRCVARLTGQSFRVHQPKCEFGQFRLILFPEQILLFAGAGFRGSLPATSLKTPSALVLNWTVSVFDLEYQRSITSHRDRDSHSGFIPRCRPSPFRVR